METTPVTKAQHHLFPSIKEHGLDSNAKTLNSLFSRYMQPTKLKNEEEMDRRDRWGTAFQAMTGNIKAADAQAEAHFFADSLIYHLYQEIVQDKSAFPDNVQRINIPEQVVSHLV